MLDLLLSLPGPAALVLGAALLALVAAALRGNLRFLILFGVLLACRAVICAQFHLLFTGGGVLAAVLGSLADFTFLAPLLFLRPGVKRLSLTMAIAALVVAANVADTGYSLESGFRLQYMLFENLDLTALLIRRDYLIITAAGAAALLLSSYLLFFRLPSGVTRRRDAALLLGLCAAMLVSGFIEAPPIRLLAEAVQNARSHAMLGVVADSSVRNFFMDAIRPTPNLLMEEQPYTAAERDLLERAGIGGASQRNPEGGSAVYDRVICVFVESLSRSFVAGPEARPAGARPRPGGNGGAGAGGKSGANAAGNAAGKATANATTGPAAMPFLHALLSDNKGFSLAGYHSSAFSTNDAIYAALASRPDFGGDFLAGRSVDTVFSQAGAKGFRTAFFLGSSGEFAHLARNYKRLLKVDEVFDKDSDFGLPPAVKHSQWGETDDRVFAKALAWMREHAGESFVIGISTIDTHPPFYSEGPPPPGFADTPLARALFSTDAAIAGFVGALRAEGLLDARTLLIITADHQISHGGKVVLDALPGGEFGDRSIPIAFLSGNPAPLRGLANPPLCSAVDLAPTLGDLLGLPERAGRYGKSLFLADGHYDLALARDATLYFRTPGGPPVTVKLNAFPRDERERALYKWYFNTQQGYPYRRDAPADLEGTPAR